MIRKICLTGFLAFAAIVSTAKAAVLVSETDIADAVKKEFVEQGVEQEMELELFGGQTSFAIDEASRFKIMVSTLKYDELQNKFSADVEIFADGKHYAQTALQGKYYLMTEISVPARNINKGEIIGREDLKKISVRVSRVKPQFVAEEEKLLNKEAKRALKESRMISEKDIGDKVVIRKGDIVTSVYKTRNMQITAKSEALSDGSVGGKVEVMNVKSKKTMFGRVIDADTVEIEAR